MGCYLSHYGCAEKFLETDADYLVVLEDDIEVLPNFKQNLESLLSYLDQHKELDWYTVNIAAKKKKLAKDIVEFDHYSLWHAYYFPIRGVGLDCSFLYYQRTSAQTQGVSLPNTSR